jgi:imidazolonepropionase-like amidohydrolase
MHTVGAAEALGMDGIVGSVESNKLADLVHFDVDLRALSPEALAITSPTATMVGGRWVTTSSATSAAARA